MLALVRSTELKLGQLGMGLLLDNLELDPRALKAPKA